MTSSFQKSVPGIKKHSCVETGTAVFAFLNVISASIGVLICLNVLVLYIWEAFTHTDVIDTFMWTMCLSFNLLAAVSMMFAIVLFVGIIKKKPAYVLAYFIFGVIILITLVSGLVAHPYESQALDKKIRELVADYEKPITALVIGICVVYASLLAMVCRTWYVMSSRRSEDHKKLVNDYCESDWRAD